MRSPLEIARRGLWVLTGLGCVGLGALGIIVPGLPSTVFFIAAAACFSKSNERLERWVLGLPGVGPAVERYRAGLGMPKSAKRFAIGSIVVFSTLSVLVLGPPVLRVGIAVLGAIGVWYVGWRVPTTPAGADEPDGRPATEPNPV